jgi:N-acetylmuramoyl-L-alanine amidase
VKPYSGQGSGLKVQTTPNDHGGHDVRRLSCSTLLLLLALAAPASAEVAHTVQPGETLWSIAAANNLTTRTVAAYNGLSEDAQVVLGSTIRVPTVAEGAAVLAGAGAAGSSASGAGTGGGYVVQPGDTLSGIAAANGTTVSALAAANGLDPNGLLIAGRSLSATGGGGSAAGAGAPQVQGAYTVRPGDTLSGLAAGAGVSVSDMAAMNGLDANGLLIAGTVIKLPSGAPAPARSAEPAPAPVVPPADPAPTPTNVGAGDVQAVAAQYGVSPSLAAAIAWQESGFNNAMVSSANARGVMQVMPGTWDYVQQNLAQRPLDPNSATDNVHAGVMYLRRLLDDTGGDENAAIAGYYQGLQSVRDRGMYDDTQQYVDNVQALRGRFGG